MLSHIGLLLWLSYEAKTDSLQADKNKVTYGLLGKPKKPIGLNFWFGDETDHNLNTHIEDFYMYDAPCLDHRSTWPVILRVLSGSSPL